MAVPIAAGLMAVTGLTLVQPAAADTLSYPYEVSSSSAMAVDWTTPNPVALTVGNTDDGLGTVLLPFRVNSLRPRVPTELPRDREHERDLPVRQFGHCLREHRIADCVILRP